MPPKLGLTASFTALAKGASTSPTPKPRHIPPFTLPSPPSLQLLPWVAKLEAFTPVLCYALPPDPFRLKPAHLRAEGGKAGGLLRVHSPQGRRQLAVNLLLLKGKGGVGWGGEGGKWGGSRANRQGDVRVWGGGGGGKRVGGSPPGRRGATTGGRRQDQRGADARRGGTHTLGHRSKDCCRLGNSPATDSALLGYFPHTPPPRR